MTPHLQRPGIKAWNFPLELWIAGLFAACTLLVGWAFSLPLSLPNSDRAAFVGIHYLYPLLAVAIWAIAACFQGRQAALTCFVALPSYTFVLLCHFNLKLWIPHLNPILWDEFFWSSDQAVRPLVEAAMYLRVLVSPLIPLDGNAYMISFMALFYISFIYFCFFRLDKFRELVIAVFLLQILGSIGYILMPALGPFLYEQGVEPMASAAQASMLASWQQNSELGAQWLTHEGGRQLTVGLAAMPSLHTGGSFLFVLFAHRNAKRLNYIFAPVFVFIAIDAVANRWHYVVDLPAGLAVAFAAAAGASYLVKLSSPNMPVGRIVTASSPGSAAQRPA